MKRLLVFIFAPLVLAGAVLFIRFLSGPEDNWLCQNGQWVKHGQPSSSQPKDACPGYYNGRTEDILQP